jgi:O-antigen ligase
MKRCSAVLLPALLFYSIAVLWVEERWAWTIFQLGIFALAAAWLIAVPLGRRAFVWSAALAPLAGALAWGAIQLAANRTIYSWKTWLSLLDWLTFLAAAFVALQVFSDPARRHRFLRAVAWFALILSVVSALQTFTSHGLVYWVFPTGYQDFVLGPFVYRNQYAAFIELLLPVVLWHALVDGRRAWIWWVTAAVMFASVIGGASRAGSILVSIEILVFLAIAAAQQRVSAADAGLTLAKLLACAALLTAVVGWDVLWQRLQQPDPFAFRREIFSSSINMVRARPMWGFGLGTWPTAYPRFATFDNGTFINQAHDDWMQWASEGGFPLLLLMLSLVTMTVLPAVRSLWGLGVLFVLAHAAVDYPLQQRPALATWFFFFVVMIVQADRQRRTALLDEA